MLIYSSALIAGQDLVEGLGPELLEQEVGLLEPGVKNRQSEDGRGRTSLLTGQNGLVWKCSRTSARTTRSKGSLYWLSAMFNEMSKGQ